MSAQNTRFLLAEFQFIFPLGGGDRSAIRYSSIVAIYGRCRKSSA